ncbi:MAG: hypothetical protein RLY58_2424 [Pseudomonadota bacterium]|jgi:hypothetical protein
MQMNKPDDQPEVSRLGGRKLWESSQFRQSEMYQETLVLMKAEIETYAELFMDSVKEAAFAGVEFDDLEIGQFIAKSNYDQLTKRDGFAPEDHHYATDNAGRFLKVRGFMLANKDKILKMRNDRINIQQISKILMIGAETIKQFLDEFGDDNAVRQQHIMTSDQNDRIKNMTADDRLEIAKHAIACGNYTKTAETYGISRTTIRKYIRSFGLSKLAPEADNDLGSTS